MNGTSEGNESTVIFSVDDGIGTSKYAVIERGLWKIVPVILISFGTFGNILAISILLRKKLRAISSNIYLLALTLTDLLILYLGLFRRWLNQSFDVDMRLEMGCGPHIWLLYTCLGCSSWVLVALTLERTISVKFPVYSRNGFSRKSAITVLASLLIAIAAFNSVYIFAYRRSLKYSDSPPQWNSTFTFACMREQQMTLLIEIWFWLDLTFTSLMPFSFLLICNTYIAHTLFLKRKERGQISNNIHNRPITKLLVVLSVMFAITTLPVRLTLCLVPADSSQWQNDKFKMWWAISNLLMYINNTVNFILYCSFGTRFRNELKTVLNEILTYPRKTCFAAKPYITSSFDNAAYRSDGATEQSD